MSHLTDTRALADQIRHLRHMADMGGWLTAGYFNGISELQPVRDALVADGHIVAGQRGHIRTYELTDAGRAWLSENGIGS